MKRLISISTIFLFSASAAGQELKFGFNVGTHLVYRTKFDQPIFIPENSYYIYQEKSAGAGVINKTSVFNSLSVGGLVTASYKRFTLNIEPQYFFQRTIYKFKEPTETERVIGKKALRIPIYGTYKFWKKENSTYLIAGLIFHSEANYDLQNPGGEVYFVGKPYAQSTINFGDNHFYNVLYDDKPYWSSMLGIGKVTRRGLNYSLRFHRRLNTEKRGIEGRIWNLELNIGYLFLSTRDFTKKHYLYFD